MSDPDGPVPDLTAEDSLLNRSSAADAFADSLPDTFAAWLDELKPVLKPHKDLVSAQSADEDKSPPREFRFEGTLRVDGSASGALRSLTGTLILGEAADLDSNVVVATAIIDGSLHGDIHATERVELQSHAKVFGNIESPALAIQPGAVFEGQCHFLPSPSETATGESESTANQQTDHDSLAGSPKFESDLKPGEAEAAVESFAAAAVR